MWHGCMVFFDRFWGSSPKMGDKKDLCRPLMLGKGAAGHGRYWGPRYWAIALCIVSRYPSMPRVFVSNSVFNRCPDTCALFSGPSDVMQCHDFKRVHWISAPVLKRQTLIATSMKRNPEPRTTPCSMQRIKNQIIRDSLFSRCWT